MTLRRGRLGALAGAALFVLPLAAAAADPAGAAPRRSVAVLSLLGNELNMVVRRISTGSQPDSNRRESIPIDEPAFDEAAMDAAARALEEAMPGAERLRFGIRDKALFALQDGLLQPAAASDGMRKGLQELLAKIGATHLLPVTKRRDDFLFKLADGNIVCHAYVKLTLVEAASLRVVAARSGTEQLMTSTTHSKNAATAWEVLPAKAKVENLIQAIDGAAYAATREIAAAAR